MTTDKPRWYCVTRSGMATLCADEEDARREAATGDREYPRPGPHQAVMLGDVAELTAELDRARAEVARSERRAITFGDLLHQTIIGMRAAVVAGRLEGAAVGLRWIENALDGPGHLPDIDEARALGGAQALFDKEIAEHEQFRKEHPAP